MTKGYLFQKGKLPSLPQAAAVTSININTVSKIQKDQDPAMTFNGWRDQVMEKYKNGSITINDLKRDLDALDIREDLFKIRAEFGKALNDPDFAWSESNSTSSSTADRT